jgi:hypothetical protein
MAFRTGRRPALPGISASGQILSEKRKPCYAAAEPERRSLDEPAGLSCERRPGRMLSIRLEKPRASQRLETWVDVRRRGAWPGWSSAGRIWKFQKRDSKFFACKPLDIPQSRQKNICRNLERLISRRDLGKLPGGHGGLTALPPPRLPLQKRRSAPAATTAVALGNLLRHLRVIILVDGLDETGEQPPRGLRGRRGRWGRRAGAGGRRRPGRSATARRAGLTGRGAAGGVRAGSRRRRGQRQ